MKHIQKKVLVVFAAFIVFIAGISYLSIHKKTASTNWDTVLGNSSQLPDPNHQTQPETQTSSSPGTPSQPLAADSSGTRSSPQDIMIDIKGAVQHPGVYPVNVNSRLLDAVQLAGGFLENADSNQLNLAQRVQDEMVIYVPRKGEVVSQTISSMQAPPTAHGQSSSSQAQGKVHLNTASESELEALPGIGPSKAKAIFDYRQKNGPFTTIDDLANVTGIGAKTVERLKSDLSLN